jgi:hypothetical protein
MRRLVGLPVITLAAAALIGIPGTTATGSPVSWHPAAVGGLDCNGYSLVQRPIKLGLPCADIASNDDEGFLDNGHYVGHDEADVGFFSRTPGSGGNMRYRMVLPVDPHTNPAPSFNGPTWDFQLAVARWFGMTMCDNQSYPEGTKVCHPNSDNNIQVPPRPDHAGAAFLELQFYPPGHPPFISSISCDRTHWCAALTIDSLEAEYGALHGPGSPPNAKTNPNCTEPVNFAWIQRNGNPTGPPGPDRQTNASFTPDQATLRMNPGDVVDVTLRDTPGGIRAEVADRTTGQSGFMVGGSSSGFRHILWDPDKFTCNGAPYDFHPMYDTAAPPLPNGQPRAWTTWAAHTDNIAYDSEIGHFEPQDGSDVDDTECTRGPLVPGCLSFSSGGDVDFDGYAYHRDWPNGSGSFPTPNYVTSPRSLNSAGQFNTPYPTVRFETDLPRIEEANNGGGLDCDHHTGANCTVPPEGATFYPWYHLASVPSVSGVNCAWALSNDLPNQISNFGGMRQAWGPLELTNYGFDKRYHNFARTLSGGNPCP